MKINKKSDITYFDDNVPGRGETVVFSVRNQ